MTQTITNLGIAVRNGGPARSDAVRTAAVAAADANALRLEFGDLQTRLAAAFRVQEAARTAARLMRDQHAPEWVASPMRQVLERAEGCVSALLRKEGRLLDRAEAAGVELDPDTVAV